MDFSKVNYKEKDGGFVICFGEKEIKTPVKNYLCAPCEKMAIEIVKEWHSLSDKIDWAKLPMSSHLGAVLDNTDSLEKWRSELVSFASSDLLCYLASKPKELKQEQEQKWLPLIDKINKELGINLQVTYGISPIKQPQDSLDKINVELEKYDLFEIFTLRSWTGFLNSFVLAYAIINGWLDMKSAFEISLLDEEWQENQWGKDAQAMKARDNNLKDFEKSHKFYELLK